MTMKNPLAKIFRRGASLNVVTPGDEGTMMGEAEPVFIDSADAALTIPAVYRCVRIVSESVANLPLLYERRRGGVYEAQPGGFSALLGLEPNEWTGAFDFFKQAVQTVLLFGEAIIIPQYGAIIRDIVPQRLILCTPGTAHREMKLGTYRVDDVWQGISGTFSEREVIHLKGLSVNGRDCLSVIAYGRETASISATASANTLKQFANGGTTMGIVSNEQGLPGYGEYQGSALEALAGKMNRAFKRNDRIVALPGKASYQNISMTAADMQALENRKFTVREICRLFGVHPSFVFDDTSNNYKSAEMANVAFMSNTLEPLLRQIENEFQRKLLPASEYGRSRFRFDREELHATDLEARMAYFEKRIQTGTMTVNEARARMGMQPVEGGDVVLVSANLRPITEVKTDTTTNSEA